MVKGGLSRFVLFSALAFGLIGSLVMAGKADPDTPQVPPFKPAAPLDIVMEKIDDLFAEVGTKLSEDPAKVLSPKEQKKYKKEAQFLAELFNVVQYHKGEKDFVEWSKKNKDEFTGLAAEFEKSEKAALKTRHDSIEKTCSACHGKYRDK